MGLIKAGLIWVTNREKTILLMTSDAVFKILGAIASVTIENILESY